MCIGGKTPCTCDETIAPECWEHWNEQQAREYERDYFEEHGVKVIAKCVAFTILSSSHEGIDEEQE